MAPPGAGPECKGEMMDKVFSMDACGVWSPHAPTTRKVGREHQRVPVQCNRPAGHSGNHMWSTTTGARLAEWEPATVVR